MKLRDKPEGQFKDIIIEQIPILSQTRKNLKQQSQGTLLDVCMKLITKQRLYGYFNKINNSYLYPHKHQKILTPQSLQLRNHAFHSQQLKFRKKYRKNFVSLLPSIQNKHSRNPFLSRQELSKSNKRNRYGASVDNIAKIPYNQLREPSQSSEKNPESKLVPKSFLSEINCSDKSRLKKKDNVPYIGDRGRNNSIRSNQMALERQFFRRYMLKQSIWSSFCQPIKKTIKPLIQQVSIVNEIRKIYFSKQLFKKYMFKVIPRLMQQVYNFFELHRMIRQGMKKHEYEDMIKKLLHYSDRVWSFIIFKYWDVNRSGKIQAKDLYEIFIQLSECKVQSSQEIILKLKEEIQRYNKLLKICQNNQECYLEQTLLYGNRLCVSDLQTLIGSNKCGIKDNSMIDITQMNTRRQSCYRACIIAKDHDSNNRANEYRIQQIKKPLLPNKKEHLEEAHPHIGEISYSYFVKSDLANRIKPIILQLFGMVQRWHNQ